MTVRPQPFAPPAGDLAKACQAAHGLAVSGLGRVDLPLPGRFDVIPLPVAFWVHPRGFMPMHHDGQEPRGRADISLEAEIPEDLFNGMHEFMRSHPHWDQYRLITSALAGFLFQNGCSDRCVTQHYLDGLFMKAGSS